MDNFVTKTALYDLPGSLPQGSYSFSIDAYSRAFNPAGDGGGPGHELAGRLRATSTSIRASASP